MSLEGNFLKNLSLPEYLLSLNLPTFGTRCKIILHAHVLPNNRPRSPWHSAYCCLSLSFNIVCRCLSTRPAASQPALGNPPLCPHLLQLPTPGSCTGLHSVKAHRHNSSACLVPRYGIAVLSGPQVAWRAIPWVRERPQTHLLPSRCAQWAPTTLHYLSGPIAHGQWSVSPPTRTKT